MRPIVGMGLFLFGIAGYGQAPERSQLLVKVPPVETEDAILGSWELVPERSHFFPNAAPPKEVRTYVRSPLLDTIVLRQVNNLTAEATLKHGEVVLASERRELTADGKTMSITVKDVTSAEHPISSTAVYRKVAGPVQ